MVLCDVCCCLLSVACCMLHVVCRFRVQEQHGGERAVWALSLLEGLTHVGRFQTICMCLDKHALQQLKEVRPYGYTMRCHASS